MDWLRIGDRRLYGLVVSGAFLTAFLGLGAGLLANTYLAWAGDVLGAIGIWLAFACGCALLFMAALRMTQLGWSVNWAYLSMVGPAILLISAVEHLDGNPLSPNVIWLGS